MHLINLLCIMKKGVVSGDKRQFTIDNEQYQKRVTMAFTVSIFCLGFRAVCENGQS